MKPRKVWDSCEVLLLYIVRQLRVFTQWHVSGNHKRCCCSLRVTWMLFTLGLLFYFGSNGQVFFYC